MASNLNKAFMRAYAKDSGRTVANPASAPVNPPAPAPENARPIAANAHRPAAYQPVPQPAPQQASQAPVAAPHFRTQSIDPANIIGGRSAPKTAATAAATASVDPAAAADAASVWQRLDAAQAVQPPHAAGPHSRPIAAAVGVGTASGPRRMQAGAAAPVAAPVAAPAARTPGMRQPGDLPLLRDDADASDANPQAADARRRTVADFLYSAGKISTSAARSTQPAAAHAPVSMNAAPIVRTDSAPAAAQQGRAGIAPAGRAHAAVASAAASSLYAASAVPAAPVHAPAYAPMQPADSEMLPQSYSPSLIQPPSQRDGHILRVDVPGQARHSEAPANLAMPAAATVGSAVSNASPQPRVDRAQELSATEQKLRRSTHKIFNPVWEVDSLQWPSVCDKLMEHRAESMAQVAAHLKAACQDGLNILGVTSPSSGEGRTTVACCLARLAAAHGLNVVLIDLDLDHPTLCLQTNLEVEQDWRDCLDGDIALEEVAVHSIDDQLTLLPLKDRSDRSELLASDMGIADILRELSESFELVIVDACRMDSPGNVLTGLAAAQVFDAAIVVVDRRNSHQERIEHSVRALQQTGVGSIGIVDNFSM